MKNRIIKGISYAKYWGKALLFGCTLPMVAYAGSTAAASASADQAKEFDEATLFKNLHDKLHHITIRAVRKMAILPEDIIKSFHDECDEAAINSYLVHIGLRPAYLLQMAYSDCDYPLEVIESLPGDQKQSILEFMKLIPEFYKWHEELTHCIRESDLHVNRKSKSSVFISKEPLLQDAIESDSMETTGKILGYPYKLPPLEEPRISIKFILDRGNKSQEFLNFVCAHEKNDRMINEDMRSRFERGLQKVDPEWKVTLEEQTIASSGDDIRAVDDTREVVLAVDKDNTTPES